MADGMGLRTNSNLTLISLILISPLKALSMWPIGILINTHLNHSTMSKPILFALFMLGIGMMQANAQSDSTMMMAPIQADRPDQTESAYLVPKGYFQMEHGFSIEDTDPGFIYSYPSSLWKYGVNDNFEIRLTTDYITIQHEPDPDLNGFLPLSIGFKSKLSEEHGLLPQMAFIGHMVFPGIVSKELETTYFAPSLQLAFNHNVSDFFSVGYTVGAAWDGETGEPNFLYSLSPSISITDRLGLFVEGYGSTPQRDEDEIELRVDAGLTYLIGNDFLLDVSAGKGITDNAPEQFVSFGFSYRFKL